MNYLLVLMCVEDISNCLGHGEIKHSDILFTF